MNKFGMCLSAAVLAGGLTTITLSADAAHADEPVIQGTISKIDQVSGRIELRTDKGPAHIYLSPEGLKNLKAGDQVALERKTAGPNQEAYERDMEERFPATAKPDEDIVTKSKQVGS